MRIWLDDVRPMPKEGFDIWARNVGEVLRRLLSNEVDMISFDHDLGEFSETGYHLAKFIEVMAFDGRIKPIAWEIHSANPVGRKNIQQAMRKAEEFWEKSEGEEHGNNS